MRNVTNSGKATVSLPSDTEIVIARDFDAPRHLVYKAWTTPELIERWWSGERGEVTSVEVDLRVGGQWRYVMVANAGFEVAFHGEYREIVSNERLVSTEVFEGAPVEDPDALATLNTVTLEETDGRTTLTTLTECFCKEVRDMIIESGMEGGMQEAMDKLERVARSIA
jgi:uncharacterized protein YndB with AHSA1/START domain